MSGNTGGGGGIGAVVGGIIGAAAGSFFGGVGSIPGYAVGAAAGAAIGGAGGAAVGGSQDAARAGRRLQNDLFTLNQKPPTLPTPNNELIRASRAAKALELSRRSGSDATILTNKLGG